MSVLAGRLFIAVAFLATTGCVIWAVTAPRPGSAGVALGLGVVAGVFLIAGLLLFPRFVEARIEGDAVVVRRVLGRRAIPVADVREAVVLHGVMLPSRVAGPLTRRLVLRGESTVLDAFSTPTDEVHDELHRRDVRILEVHEPLSPSVARRRFPGSASLAEAALRPALAVLVVAVLGVAAVIVLA